MNNLQEYFFPIVVWILAASGYVLVSINPALAELVRCVPAACAGFPLSLILLGIPELLLNRVIVRPQRRFYWRRSIRSVSTMLFAVLMYLLMLTMPPVLAFNFGWLVYLLVATLVWGCILICVRQVFWIMDTMDTMEGPPFSRGPRRTRK